MSSSSKTLEQLITLVRQRADMENSLFVSDEEIVSYIQNSYTELYDLITMKYEDYNIKEEYFTVDTSAKHKLPSDFFKLRGVDYKLAGGDAGWCTVTKWVFSERNRINRSAPRLYLGSPGVQYRVLGNSLSFVPQSLAPGQYRMFYTPICPTLTHGKAATLSLQGLTYTARDLYSDGNLITVEYVSGGVVGAEAVTVTDGLHIQVAIDAGFSTDANVLAALQASDEAMAIVSVTKDEPTPVIQAPQGPTNLSGAIVKVDLEGINGWDEYVIVDAAIKCLIKEESDPSALMATKQNLLARVESAAANRDSAIPERISDTSGAWGDDGFWGRGWNY
jgi:hypothetical protein